MNQVTFFVQKQSQAEKDQYLVDCFHDSGFLKEIIENDYGILAGRKGTGKTAIARYLEKKYQNFDLLLSKRISITSFADERDASGEKETRERILQYILLSTAYSLDENNFLLPGTRPYWAEVFKQAGVNKVTSFELYTAKTKKKKFSLNWKIFGGESELESVKTEVELKSEELFNSLIESLDDIGQQTSHLFFIDDLSDYLDDLDNESLKSDLNVIRDVLLKLELFNTTLKDNEKSLRFVCCIRDDLFEFMGSSNTNKLRQNSLYLKWNEESFAGLVIRRLPHFSENLEEALADPVNSLKKLFPDSIFSEKLEQFETNRYHSNFYAYIVAISFNRPRDFLSFCFALRDRLSMRHEVSLENIDAAEMEYSDYFKNEIVDELHLASKILEFENDRNSLEKVVDLLAIDGGFNSSQLRNDIAQLFGTKTSRGGNKIESFIYKLWFYGIIGYKSKESKLISFKYIPPGTDLVLDNIKNYRFYLHRGLWWFSKKRRKK